jgi:Ca-activated chloride channel family protein
MTNQLSLEHVLNTHYVPITNQPRLLYLLVEVGGGGGRAAGSLPANLSIVVDKSESMHIRLVTDEQFEELARRGLLKEVLVDGVPAWHTDGLPDYILKQFPRKIDRVKDALRAAVEQLRPKDRFALVAFAGQASVLVPSSPATEKRRILDKIEALEQLQLGDDTYMAQGIARGFEEAQQGASSQTVNRMVVLTDGFTLDEPECWHWTERAQAAGVSISTMGLGGEFNHELMIPIAERTGGEAYLLQEPEDVVAAFAAELSSAQAITFRNLELKLRLVQGVELRDAYRVKPAIAHVEELANVGGSYNVPLGDLAEGAPPAVVLELIAPPRPAGTYRLVQTLLAYDDPAGGLAGVKVRGDVVVEYTANPALAAQLEPRVMHVVEAVSAYKLQQRAQHDLEAGDVPSATRRLRAAATRLLDMGEGELAMEMEQQAAELEQGSQANPQRTKKLRYETRKLTQKLD